MSKRSDHSNSHQKIAGMSLWKFLDELRKRNVTLKYSIADAEAEIESAISEIRRFLSRVGP
jgi:hypothetical protein